MIKKLLLLTTLTLNIIILSGNSMAKENISEEVLQNAYFAGGCFWCMEPVFDNLEGVTETIVGYSGGSEKDANYDDVSTKQTEHIEAIRVSYDPKKISFNELLEAYIKNVDPLDPYGQFADKGPQYLTAVLYNNLEEKEITEKYFKKVKDEMILKGEIQVKIEPVKNFFEAEDYHQDYYKKNPLRYNAYKYGSGRPKRLKEVWGEK